MKKFLIILKLSLSPPPPPPSHMKLKIAQYRRRLSFKIDRQLRARRAIPLCNNDPLRTRRALLLYNIYSDTDSAFLALYRQHVQIVQKMIIGLSVSITMEIVN